MKVSSNQNEIPNQNYWRQAYHVFEKIRHLMGAKKHNFEDFRDQHAHDQDIPMSFQHFRRALLVFKSYRSRNKRIRERI